MVTRLYYERESENPYRSMANSSENGVKSVDWVRRILCMVLSVIGVLLVAGIGVQVDLRFRFPTLEDPSAGPAYYWPSDLFEFLTIVNAGTFLAFVYFGSLLFLRVCAEKRGIDA